jgi:hypothetical protein
MEARSNVLVVDNEVGSRESLKVILKPFYNVYTANGGRQAEDYKGDNKCYHVAAGQIVYESLM